MDKLKSFGHSRLVPYTVKLSGFRTIPTWLTMDLCPVSTAAAWLRVLSSQRYVSSAGIRHMYTLKLSEPYKKNARFFLFFLKLIKKSFVNTEGNRLADPAWRSLDPDPHWFNWTDPWFKLRSDSDNNKQLDNKVFLLLLYTHFLEQNRQKSNQHFKDSFQEKKHNRKKWN